MCCVLLPWQMKQIFITIWKLRFKFKILGCFSVSCQTWWPKKVSCRSPVPSLAPWSPSPHCISVLYHEGLTHAGGCPGPPVQGCYTLVGCSTSRRMDWEQWPAQALGASTRPFRQEIPGAWVSTVWTRREGHGLWLGIFLWPSGFLFLGEQPEEGQSKVSKVWGQVSAMYWG